MKKLLAVIVSIITAGIILVGCGETNYNDSDKFETTKANIISYYVAEETDLDVVPMIGTSLNSNNNLGTNVGFAYKNNVKQIYVFNTKELGEVKISSDKLRMYKGEPIEEEYIIYHKAKKWYNSDMVEWHTK